MPALTIGVVSLKVRVMDVENIIWILWMAGDDRCRTPQAASAIGGINRS
jgi:hypothetical protein